jgi:putative ABC transport system permease protein
MRLRLLLRQATSSIGASIVIVLIVAVAAGLFTAWPRVSRATFTEEVNFRIDETPVTARALTGRQVGGWPMSPWGGETFDDVADQAAALLEVAGPTLRPLVGDPELMITAGLPVPLGVSFSAATEKPDELADRGLAFRASRTLPEHVEFVDGEVPGAWTIPGLGTDEGPQPSDPIPVALSVATAERIGVTLGEELDLTGLQLMVDAADARAVVTGLFEATDPDDPYWLHQANGLTPLIINDPDVGDFAIGTLYVDPDTMGLLQLSNLSPTTDVWVPVAAGAENAPALLDDLREIVARDLSLGDQSFGGVNVRLETALIGVLDASLTSQRGTAAVLTLVAAGPVGVVFALLALATRLSVSRRRATLALASARGGSPWQIRGALAAEGLALGVPAALVGAAVATLLVRGSVQLGDYALPALAASAPAAFLAAERLPNLRTQRQDLSTRSSSRWRWVAEVLVVAVAAGALYLLLSRGLQATTTTSVDPLATATPLLISLATAVLATRLFPYPMRLVHAAARRRRGLAGFLGSARAIRESGAGLVPMLALLVATSIAVFSTTMLTTLTGGVSESTLAATGADVRLAGPAYDDDVVADIEAVAGVAGTARVFSQPQTQITAGTTTRQVTLYAVDTAG